jgi:hypothetical protein
MVIPLAIGVAHLRTVRQGPGQKYLCSSLKSKEILWPNRSPKKYIIIQIQKLA